MSELKAEENKAEKYKVKEMKSKFTYAQWRTDKPKEPGYSHELISSSTEQFCKESGTDMDTLEGYLLPGCDTLVKALEIQVKEIPNNPFLGTRVGNKYEWMTFKEVVDYAKALSVGYNELGMIPPTMAEDKEWRFIGIQAKNQKQWLLVHFANMYQKVTSVALYDTLGVEATRFCIDQTEMITIAGTMDCLRKLCKIKKDEEDKEEQNLRRLKYFIAMGTETIDQADRTMFEDHGISVFTIQEVHDKGLQKMNQLKDGALNPPSKDDVFILSYTSGTTGVPKGVKISHKMVLNTAFAVNSRMAIGGVAVGRNDCYISYLPAAHSFEQALVGCACQYGVRIGFFGGDVLKLVEDCAILQPTFFPSVPRLYNRIYGKLQDRFKEATGCKAKLINSAVAAKMAKLNSGGGVNHCLYDKLVFKKVQAMLGGKVKVMLTGSAPIDGKVLKFLKACFCCPIIEGYGMTETCAGSLITFPLDTEIGHVGGPLQNVKLRLRDIPEMNYLHTDPNPRGEVCFFGTGIMSGYFKNQEKTQEAFSDPATQTNNGWMHSGDVGMVLPNGAVKIIDRAKNIFKLSQGEYIAPEKLENIYVQSEWVAQSWMYGDSLRDNIIGIVVVDPDRLAKYALDIGKKADDSSLLNDDLKKIILEDLIKLAKANEFSSLEKPKYLVLRTEQFTIENDLLTPTMKLKRNIAKIQFQTQIDEAYEAIAAMAAKK